MSAIERKNTQEKSNTGNKQRCPADFRHLITGWGIVGLIAELDWGITMNITESNITSLAENQIFVFGSNESGRHGKGAAKTALKWGAKYGQAEGLQGRTYGIPTVNASISKSLSVEKIKTYVDRFLLFAKERQDLHFLVTEIGCGLAGLTPKQIAPLFRDAVEMENISLPSKFIKVIKVG